MVNDSVFFCDVSNCKKSTYCNYNASNFNEESMASTCLCYDSATIKHLHEFKFLKLTWLVSLGVGLLLIVLPIIMFFNINLVSGTSHSFVFFYQCLPLVSQAGGFLSLIVMQNQLYTFLLSFTVPGSRNLPLVSAYYFLEYFKYVLSIIAIVLVLFLVKCNCCPFQKCCLPWAKLRRATRHFREKHTARRTILHGIGSVIVYWLVVTLYLYPFTYYLEDQCLHVVLLQLIVVLSHVLIFHLYKQVCQHSSPLLVLLLSSSCSSQWPSSTLHPYLLSFTSYLFLVSPNYIWCLMCSKEYTRIRFVGMLDSTCCI